jgi:PTH1 family peptidyl-tRNA hydrolase
MRLGIGGEFSKGQQVDFVLGEWEKSELEIVREMTERAVSAVESWALEGIEMAMNRYN